MLRATYPAITGRMDRAIDVVVRGNQLGAFARYVETLGDVNPGPQNRITLVP